MVTSKFIRVITDNEGTAVEGALVYLVESGASFNTDMPLTEHVSRLGYYSRANVPDGEYDIYMDLGEGAVIYEEKVWHGEKIISDIAAAIQTDVTDYDVSTSKHGLAPKLPNDGLKFLNGLGEYSTPGSGSFINFPLNTAIPKVNNFYEEEEEINYNHFGIISCNPINGHLVSIYRQALSHSDDVGKGYIRHSSNGGGDWGAKLELIDGGIYDIRNFGGGYDRNGRLWLFYGVYNLGTAWVSLNMIYSDDDGSTWSNAVQMPVLSSPIFSPYGTLVDMGGGLMYQTAYAVDGATYKIYYYKTTDYGANWTTVTVYSGSKLLTEPSMIDMGGGNLLIVTRINSGATLNQFLSINGGANWTDQGATSFETWSTDTSRQPSPYLFKFNYNGACVIGCYYAKRDLNPNLLKVIYALPKNLITGANGWNAATIKTIHTYSGSSLCGMPTAVHNGNFYGLFNHYDHVSPNDAFLFITPTPPHDLAGIMAELGL